MTRGSVGSPTLRDRVPDADDYGAVVRTVGPVNVTEATYQRRFDIFVSNANFIYVGYAAQGAAPTEALWLIKRITFASGNPTMLQWSGTQFTAVWDEHTTISYT